MTDPNRLIDAYLDGTLANEELERLEQGLARNPQYADAFASAMMINELLGERFEREALVKTMRLDDGSFLGEADLKHLQDDYDQAEADLVTMLDLDAKLFARKNIQAGDALLFTEAVLAIACGVKSLVRSKPTPFIACAIAALLLITLWLINPFAGSEQPGPGNEFVATPTEIDQPVVATLTAEHDAVWARRPGENLYANQRFTLTQGFAEITTNDGAVAILEAPVTIELLDNDNALYLHTGKLVGLCHTDTSKGFLVHTDHADIIDLGTEFGVEVKPTGLSVTVFAGEIELHAADGQPQLIQHLQTASVTLDGGALQISVLDAAADQLLASYTRRLPRSPLVTAVRLHDAAGKRAKIGAHSFYEFAKLYSDRAYQAVPAMEQELPLALLGGDVIQMPITGMNASSIGVEVTIAQPAQVYVLVPPNAELQDWLARDYERTDMIVGLEGPNAGSGPSNTVLNDRVCQVWQRKDPVTGTAIIAGPLKRNSIGMYTLVVTPLDQSINLRSRESETTP